MAQETEHRIPAPAGWTVTIRIDDGEEGNRILELEAPVLYWLVEEGGRTDAITLEGEDADLLPTDNRPDDHHGGLVYFTDPTGRVWINVEGISERLPSDPEERSKRLEELEAQHEKNRKVERERKAARLNRGG